MYVCIQYIYISIYIYIQLYVVQMYRYEWPLNSTCWVHTLLPAANRPANFAKKT